MRVLGVCQELQSTQCWDPRKREFIWQRPARSAGNSDSITHHVVSSLVGQTLAQLRQGRYTRQALAYILQRSAPGSLSPAQQYAACAQPPHLHPPVTHSKGLFLNPYSCRVLAAAPRGSPCHVQRPAPQLQLPGGDAHTLAPLSHTHTISNHPHFPLGPCHSPRPPPAHLVTSGALLTPLQYLWQHWSHPQPPVTHTYTATGY